MKDPGMYVRLLDLPRLICPVLTSPMAMICGMDWSEEVEATKGSATAEAISKITWLGAGFESTKACCSFSWRDPLI